MKDDREIAAEKWQKFLTLPSLTAKLLDRCSPNFEQYRNIMLAISARIYKATLHSLSEISWVNFDFCKKPPILMGYYSNDNFIIHIQLSTKADNLVKFGAVVSEIFVGICRLFPNLWPSC